MKEVSINIQTSVTMYEALDGKQFKDKSECIKYEDSALCALLSIYEGKVITRTNDCTLFNLNYDETIDVIKINSNEDIELLSRLWFLMHPWVQNNIRDNAYTRFLGNLQKAYEEDSYVFLGRGQEGCDPCIYFLGTKESLIAEIEKACNGIPTEEQVY